MHFLTWQAICIYYDTPEPAFVIHLHLNTFGFSCWSSLATASTPSPTVHEKEPCFRLELAAVFTNPTIKTPVPVHVRIEKKTCHTDKKPTLPASCVHPSLIPHTSKHHPSNHFTTTMNGHTSALAPHQSYLLTGKVALVTGSGKSHHSLFL